MTTPPDDHHINFDARSGMYIVALSSPRSDKADDLQPGFDRLTKLFIDKQIDAEPYRDEIRAHTGKTSTRIDAIEERLKLAKERQMQREQSAPDQDQDDDQSQDQQQ